MLKRLRLIILSVSVLVIVAFVLFVANQTAQFVGMLSSFNPALGQFVLLGLLVLYALLIAVPVLVFLRLPRALKAPPDESSPDFPLYLERVRRRLAANPSLKGTQTPLESRSDVDAAIRTLELKADVVIKKTASAIFVTTAISQNGRLDGLMSLVAQTQLVWQVAHGFHQLPALQDLVTLYRNVAVTAFVSYQIEEMDISEQVGAVLGPKLAGHSLDGVPGLGAASVVTDSIVEGLANALVTLRVGIIARKYCASLTTRRQPLLRRSATAEAVVMLGSVMAEPIALVSKAMGRSATKAGGEAISRAAQATWDAVAASASALSAMMEKTGQGVANPVSVGASAVGSAWGKVTKRPKSQPTDTPPKSGE